MNISASAVRNQLLNHAKPSKAKLLERFFKTGVGEYAEGDKFLGIMVPTQRTTAKQFQELDIKEVKKLLEDTYHEVRFTGLLILVYKNRKVDEATQKKIFDCYIKNTKYINNWDLVDVTCKDIIGKYLFERDRDLLYKFARSKNLWERRMSIVSTSYYIWKGQFDDTMAISKILLHDPHDLIQKAVGWMLREVGKRDLATLMNFLNEHAHEMPRTMLRYSLEKVKPPFRDRYMKARYEHGRMGHE